MGYFDCIREVNSPFITFTLFLSFSMVLFVLKIHLLGNPDLVIVLRRSGKGDTPLVFIVSGSKL